MKIEIIEQNAFLQIKPENLINYLIANDWQEVKKVKDELIIFVKIGHMEKKQLIWMPLNANSSDYASMVSRVVRSIAEVDNKSDLQVLEDLMTVAVGDVIRVKSFNSSEDYEGTIPLNEGIHLITRVRQMALAAASGVSDKKPVQPRRPPEEARRFVKNLKLGQTERGSFLIKLISPIELLPRIPGELDGFSERIPFSRRAVIELMNGLKALNEATKETKRRGFFNLNTFLEVVPRGVNANLCEALTSALDEKEQKDTRYEWPIEVSVTWSCLIKDKSLPSTSEVRFDPEDYPIIREAAKEFRAKNPEIVTLRGWVNILERDSRTGPGLIRVKGKIDDALKSVRVKLDPEEYNNAIDAHKKGLLVSVDGTLIVDMNIYRLENPFNFHLIADEFTPLDFRG